MPPPSELNHPEKAAGSRQVSWWPVHEYVEPVLTRAGTWPMVGTPEWERADDRVKVAALFDAARHWALRVDTCQQAMAEASHDVSAAIDWRAVANEIRRGRGNAYIPRQAVVS